MAFKQRSSGPFKMMGSSPLKQHKFPKVAKKINVGKTIKKAGHYATTALSLPLAAISVIPQGLKNATQHVTGKKTREQLENEPLNPTTTKIFKGIKKHMDAAGDIQSKKKKK